MRGLELNLQRCQVLLFFLLFICVGEKRYLFWIIFLKKISLKDFRRKLIQFGLFGQSVSGVKERKGESGKERELYFVRVFLVGQEYQRQWVIISREQWRFFFFILFQVKGRIFLSIFFLVFLVRERGLQGQFMLFQRCFFLVCGVDVQVGFSFFWQVRFEQICF